MDMHRSAARYALVLFALAVALVALVCGFNALVDPFAMYRRVEIEGFNAYKPAVFRRQRLFKAYEVERVRPQTLVLGTSRTHLGIGCSHPALQHRPGPCYNLAFDGATTKEMYHYLRHSHASRPLRHVLIGLDAYQTGGSPAFTRPDFDPLVLNDKDIPTWSRLITADLRLLASVDTLRASIDTLRLQAYPQVSWFAPDGQRLGEIFFRRPGESFVEEGPRAYFDEIDRLEVADQAPPPRPPKAGPPNASPAAGSRAVDYIERIVEFCRDEGIELRLFISPSHVRQLEIAAELGNWNGLQAGKRALVAMLDRQARHHPGHEVPLYDFTAYSPITTEPLPALGSRDEMAFYWDSSHFKSRVGDWALDRIYGTPGAQALPEEFGVRLMAVSIDDFVEAQRIAQAAYRARFPDELASLRALMSSVRRPSVLQVVAP